MFKIFLLVIVVVVSGYLPFGNAADPDYPPVLLLNELMGMASKPLPVILWKAVKSCDDISEERQEVLRKDRENCLQRRLPDIQNASINSLDKYTKQCALLPTANSTESSCYAEIMSEIEKHGCLRNANYTSYIFKYTHTLRSLVCQDPVGTLDHVNKTEDNKKLAGTKTILNRFYCDESSRRKTTENCIIKTQLTRNHDEENPNSVCADFNVMKTCLEKNYIAACKNPSIPLFFQSMLKRLEVAVCTETAEIPSYTVSENHAGSEDETSTAETQVPVTNVTTDSIPKFGNNSETGGGPSNSGASSRVMSALSVSIIIGFSTLFPTVALTFEHY